MKLNRTFAYTECSEYEFKNFISAKFAPKNGKERRDQTHDKDTTCVLTLNG